MAGSTATLPRGTPPGLPLRVSGDDRLVRLAAQGNERAFAMIYERHSRPLYRYCRSIVRNDHDAQDVLQTTMARALAALRKGPPDAPLRPWLFRIAHNEAISLLRAAKPTSELDDAAGLTAPSVEGRAEERARLALLVEDLSDLPDRQRSALVMRELSGLSHEEIATALDVSLSGAKQAIFEARVGLQEFEKGRAMECADVQRTISDADGRKLRGRPVRAHLRACAECRGMREAIGRRTTDLAALAPPLPAAAGAAILAKLFGGGGGGSIGGGGALAAGTAATAGKAGSMALGAKLAAGAAVVAVAGAGTPVIVDRIEHDPAPPSASSSRQDGLPAAASTPAAPLPAAAQQGLTTAAAAAANALATTATSAATASATHAATPASARQHGRGSGTKKSAAASHGATVSAAAHAGTGSRGSATSTAAKQRKAARGPAAPGTTRKTAAQERRPTKSTTTATTTSATTPAPAAPGKGRTKKDPETVSTVTTTTPPSPATTGSSGPRAIPPRK